VEAEKEGCSSREGTVVDATQCQVHFKEEPLAKEKEICNCSDQSSLDWKSPGTCGQKMPCISFGSARPAWLIGLRPIDDACSRSFPFKNLVQNTALDCLKYVVAMVR